MLEENCPYFLSMMWSTDTYYLENQVPVLPANIESIIGWLNFFYLLGDIYECTMLEEDEWQAH